MRPAIDDLTRCSIARRLVVELRASATTRRDIEPAIGLATGLVARLDRLRADAEHRYQARLELGVCLRKAGRFGAAVVAFDEAAAIAVAMGDLRRELAALGHAALTLQEAGDDSRARTQLLALDERLAPHAPEGDPQRRFIRTGLAPAAPTRALPVACRD